MKTKLRKLRRQYKLYSCLEHMNWGERCSFCNETATYIFYYAKLKAKEVQSFKNFPYTQSHWIVCEKCLNRYTKDYYPITHKIPTKDHEIQKSINNLVFFKNHVFSKKCHCGERTFNTFFLTQIINNQQYYHFVNNIEDYFDEFIPVCSLCWKSLLQNSNIRFAIKKALQSL